MKVSVLGLGYVGAVTAACLAKDGFDVLGVDVNPEKVRLINEGRSPVVEAGIGELVQSGIRSGRLAATVDVQEAVERSDVSIVSVGTPSRTNGSIALEAVERVSEQIGVALASKVSRHLIVVRSTILPGSMRSHVIPALEKSSGKKAGEGFEVCFNPEFLREGTSVADYYQPPFTLIGADSPKTAAKAAALYRNVPADIVTVPIETAEMVKYVCNAFHALKIAFANEVGNVAQVLGVDSHEVMKLVCRDTKLNISPKYLTPGFAFGGSCLPKDVRALLYRARQSDLDLPLLSGILASNRTQLQRGIDTVLQLKHRKVSLLGLSFKAGTDDLRESPLVSLSEALIGKGIDLRIFDAHVSLSRLVGANREYIQREIPHIESLLVPTAEEAVRHAQILVVGNASEGVERLPQLCRAGQIIVDLVRFEALRSIPGVRYIGINW